MKGVHFQREVFTHHAKSRTVDHCMQCADFNNLTAVRDFSNNAMALNTAKTIYNNKKED